LGADPRVAERDGHFSNRTSARPAFVCNSQCALFVGISDLEPLLDDREIFVLGQRTLLINICGRKLPCAQSASHFVPVEGPVVINVEPIKQGCGRLLRLIEIQRAIVVVVGVESQKRIGRLGLQTGSVKDR
jgi:hypothetical protein